MNYIKFIRIILLVLIIIGLGLLVTQKTWVPKVVNKILQSESTKNQSLSSKAVKIGKTNIDMVGVKEIQFSVDQGNMPWRLNPLDVAIVDSNIYPNGLAIINNPSPLIKQISLNIQTGIAIYVLPYMNKEYKVTVMQPQIGKNKMWVVSDIEYNT